MVLKDELEKIQWRHLGPAIGNLDMMDRNLERRKERQLLLGHIDRKNWQLWTLSFCVTLSLAFAIAAFFYPALRWHVERLEMFYGFLPQLIIGLVVMVLLCIIYIVIKQRELNELRNFLIAINLEARRMSAELPRDPLTHVLDRRGLPDILKREVTWVDRYRVPLSLVLFNVQEFHKINESKGNLAGDEVLKALATALESTARQTDTILRYGGDRFLCFLPRTDRIGAQAFGRRVNAACDRNSQLRGIQLSFGVAEYRPGSSAEGLLAEVERALMESTPQPIAA
jgi:diguanylate cyclase (GGDEF)-like protein